MKRLSFDTQGNLLGVDSAPRTQQVLVDSPVGSVDYPLVSVKDDEWSLFEAGRKLEPLRFSNGKTQQDVVDEVLAAIHRGIKVVFIKGACGTGKSAIALNIARRLGKASVVVPVKGLQQQYEKDYSHSKYVIHKNKKLKIAQIKGRDNFDSVFLQGKSCADPSLPELIPISQKNIELLQEYYDDNPMIQYKGTFDAQKMKRLAVAPTNPYWSPIVPAELELPLKGAKKKLYRGLVGRDFIFYHRKEGCGYYDQYQSYIDADVLIFNAAKYKIEVALDRKPETKVDIIDEADEFLDSFSSQMELNLTRLEKSLKQLFPDDPRAVEELDRVVEYIRLEAQQKAALGVLEDQLFRMGDTLVGKAIVALARAERLQGEIIVDEANYANKGIEVAEEFREFVDEAYVTFRTQDDDLLASFVTTNVAARFSELTEKVQALVLMSGTLHSEELLKKVFGLDSFVVIEAETVVPGTIEVVRTGKEFDCSYKTFQMGRKNRGDYLQAFSSSMSKAPKPVLVHVQAFEDLPSEGEIETYQLFNLMQKDKLKSLQSEDKEGRMISLFKSGVSESLFSTRCSRGVDFPGKQCSSIIFSKYPNPNVRGVFWKILQQTHKDVYWEVYRDKARREVIQRVYRGVRAKEDHVYILSPDLRVLEAVRELQEGRLT